MPDYSLDDLKSALVKAHNVGDKASAQKIADRIRATQSGSDKVEKVSAPAAAAQPAPEATPERSTADSLARQVGLTARAGIEGVTAIPGMIADVPFRLARLAGYKAPLPSEEQSKLLTKAGIPEPKTGVERVAQDVAGSMAGTGGIVKAAEKGATMAGPRLSSILSRLAEQPKAQIASSAAGGAAAGGTREAGGGPTEQEVMGTLGAFGPSGVSRLVRTAMRPVESFRTPEHERMIDMAEKAGFKLTAGQKTGNERLMAAESTMRRIPGGGAIQEFGEHNKKVLARKMLETVGETGDAVTPEKLASASKRIGDKFNVVDDKLQIPLGNEFVGDLSTLEQNYVRVWGGGGDIGKYLNDAIDAAASGGVDGAQYKRIRSSLQRRSISAFRGHDSDTGRALAELTEALDDAAQRAIPKNMYDDLMQARKQYRDLLVLEDATTSTAAGKSGAGIPEPISLMNAVVKSRGARSFSQTPIGAGDKLADLARLSNTIRDLIPTSGTAERMYWMHVLGGTGGGIAGALTHGAPGAVVGEAMGLATPYATTQVMMSDPVQRWLAEGMAPQLADRIPVVRTPWAALLESSAGGGR